jgi:adenosylcobinamide-GDP ribazoletransferase
MNSYLLAFKSGFGFLSTIPVGISMEGIDELMKKIYFYPIVGAVLGLLIGAVAYIGQVVFPGPVLAALIMGFIYYITGFNHLDGVTDIGDGFMAHGSFEKKNQGPERHKSRNRRSVFLHSVIAYSLRFDKSSTGRRPDFFRI